MLLRDRFTEMVYRAQDDLCAHVTALDGAPFREDRWERSGGGGGRTRVIEDATVFEKAGVNVSEVHGQLSREAMRVMGGAAQLEASLRARHKLGADVSVENVFPESLPFFAAGISTVLHPRNPFAPTSHANYRYFEIGASDDPLAWWFGGGADLTPAYLFEEDARHFHAVLRSVCDRHDEQFYPRFKRWCDEYFHIPHRGERRGIGGIFFDDLHDRSPEELLSFAEECTFSFKNAYLPIVSRRKDHPFAAHHKRWQELRRGRYVEFNLIYDRGTTFGLKTGGRVESILMSLPLKVRFEYDVHPEPLSAEAALLDVLRSPRDWLSVLPQ